MTDRATTHRLRVLFGCTSSFPLATLYKGIFPYLAANGYDVEVVVGDANVETFDPVNFGHPRIHVIPMERLPSPVEDLKALWRFVRLLSSNRYDVIHLSTPKASLLGTIAAAITRNGPVVFVYRRRVYELMRGLKKRLYITNDKITAGMSACVVPISKEIGRQLRADGICEEKKQYFIGSGSSNGIDVDWYAPTPTLSTQALELRASLGVPSGAPVMLYVGRMISEKGVDLLPAIHRRVIAAFPDTHLIAAGPLDDRDPVRKDTLEYFESEPKAHWVGYVRDPRPHLLAADVFVFPSYFEGFGNVLLEAAAMERPALGFRVSGVSEAIADGVSGLLSPEGDVEAMADQAIDLLRDPELRSRLGRAARSRVVSEYSSKLFREEVRKLLEHVSRSAGRGLLARTRVPG